MNGLFMRIRRELYEASCTVSLCHVVSLTIHPIKKLDPRDNSTLDKLTILADFRLDLTDLKKKTNLTENLAE